MKYHYSYRFFTYSVKRSRGRKALVSGVEAHQGGARGVRVERVAVRSALKTVSGGEFDWGGTSVKR